VAATVLVAATGALAAPAQVADALPAQAAGACPTSSGVTAIVDFAQLGGGVTAGCDSNGGDESASQVFRDAGYVLEYSQQPGMNGFVCKIQSKPTDGDCAGTDAFWSLWWSDGRSGRWVFSNQGVASTEVPDGGYVAFAWHQGDGQAQPPAVSPTPHAAPTQAPDEPSDSNGGNGGGSGGSGGRGDDGADGGADGDSGGSTTVAPSTSVAATATTDAPASESASPDRARKRDRPSSDPESSDPTASTSSSTVPGAAEITAGPSSSDLATNSEDDGGGALTTWVGLGLAVLVLGAAGLVTALRRRSG
jgi:hypothetical protein